MRVIRTHHLTQNCLNPPTVRKLAAIMFADVTLTIERGEIESRASG